MMNIEVTTIIIPIKWKIVNNSPSKKYAKIAVTIGVGENKIVAFETSK